MYSEDDLQRLKSIQKKLRSIDTIIQRHGSIVKALDDDIEAQPAILMLLIASAEQFNKLYKINTKLLDDFDESDIKGLIAVRNFIAHDYDGVNLSVVEDSLRYDIPRILEIVTGILEENK